MKSNLFSKAKKFPLTAGVYLFVGKNGEILYVGRAVSLRKRILNYFRKDMDSRIKEMIESAENVKYCRAGSVLEAVVLEANLIKKHWPKYNVKERDDRSFVYVVIPKTDYPKPFVSRGRDLEKFAPNAEIFGPYQNLSLVKNALKIIRRIFPYSGCSVGSGRPCFYRQIGLCPGLCVGEISKRDYQKNIKNIVLFLKGEKKKLIEKLKKENPEKIQALRHVQDVALMKEEADGWTEMKKTARRIEGYDISHFAGKETVGSMVVFINGKPDKSRYRLFKIKKSPANDDLAALAEVIERRFNHPEWGNPDLILIDGGRPQIDRVSKILKKINVNVPAVGISKYGGDKLIFQKNVKKSLRELVQADKSVLLKIREEAHRFAVSFSRRRRFENLRYRGK